MMLNRIWYSQQHPVARLLTPFAWLFHLIMKARRKLYQYRLLRRVRFPVPIIIIGNITVGGTGKTPLTIALANFLKEAGYRPGIVSRGYGRRSKQYCSVTANSSVDEVGDEALLIAEKTACPMIVGCNRVKSVELLLQHFVCDIVLSDDGMQHYALERDIEIAVIDGERRSGNNKLLPAGPLRESVSRLQDVDFIVCNGNPLANEFSMQYISDDFHNVVDSSATLALHELKGKKIHALAGIGNPERFFTYLSNCGLTIIPHVFPDHYAFSAKDIDFNEESTIIMTEKDAVKCRTFADFRHWYLPITAQIDTRLTTALLQRLRSLEHRR